MFFVKNVSFPAKTAVDRSIFLLKAKYPVFHFPHLDGTILNSIIGQFKALNERI